MEMFAEALEFTEQCYNGCILDQLMVMRIAKNQLIMRQGLTTYTIYR